MTLLTYAVPLLWLIASAAAFFFVFKPRANWPVVATPSRALLVFVVVFLGGAALTAVTRPKDVDPALRAKPAQHGPFPDPALVRAHPERYLSLERVITIKGQENAVLATGAAVNTSGLPISDPRLACQLSRRGAPAGSVSAVIHETIPVGGKLIFAAANLGPAPGSWDGWICEIRQARAG